MRISHTYKFVFIAVPRTGSTSLRDTLDSISDISSTYKYNVSEENPFYHHISAREIKNIFDRNHWNWNEYKKFCVVRNPYDRAVSLYHHRHDTNTRNAPGKPWIYNFLRRIRYTFYRKTFQEWLGSKESRHGLSRSVFDFTHGENNECLVDHFIRFENLDADFENLAKQLGFFHEVNRVSVLNSTARRHKNYRTYYAEDTIELIKERYKFELESFGYDF